MISMGVELETYSIALPEYRICREIQFPRPSSVEEGERFTRDDSIGSEYNSKVFKTIREAFFLLKSGLRKYSRFKSSGAQNRHAIFPIGGWTDRFAGTHLHLALGDDKFTFEQARRLSDYLHDHLPFLIALTGNSPVWREKITPHNSNRVLLGSKTYCQVTKRGVLHKRHFREIVFNRGGKKKSPTLEIRICDSVLPEYIAAALCVCLAVAKRWLKRKQPYNHSTHTNYLSARDQAVRFGPRAKLVWTNHWLNVKDYTDLFFRKYAEELDRMDIPDDVIRVFKYLKRGWNQSEIIRKASALCMNKHRPTWQRRFAKRYSNAVQELLDGNSYEQFTRRLGVKLPSVDRVWLGRKGAHW